MRYVLIRSDDGAFVARLGSVASYTHKMQDARIFASFDAAEANRSGNETPFPVEELLDEMFRPED